MQYIDPCFRQHTGTCFQVHVVRGLTKIKTHVLLPSDVGGLGPPHALQQAADLGAPSGLGGGSYCKVV